MVRLTVSEVLTALSKSCSVETFRTGDVMIPVTYEFENVSSIFEVVKPFTSLRECPGTRLWEAADESRAASIPHSSRILVRILRLQ